MTTGTDTPRVALVVLNYNGRDLLEEYLPPLFELDYGNYEVVVVDNDSSDDSVRFVRENYPEARVVEKADNVGISGGYNAGARAAPDADYYWFLNNDVRVTPSSLARLVDRLESEPKVGVAFPRINDMGSETIQSMGYEYDVFGQGGLPSRDAGRSSPSDETPQEVVHGMGAALLIDREVWEETGGFDERNFLYGDDTYLCLQAWVRGHHVEVVPDSVVYHEKERTIDDNPSKAYHEERSNLRTYLKSLQLGSLLVGLPGYLLIFLGVVGKDALVREQPRVALYRLWGFLAALTTLPEILRWRTRLRRERVYADSYFLTPVTETVLG